MNLMPELTHGHGLVPRSQTFTAMFMQQTTGILINGLEWLQNAKEEDWMRCRLSKRRLPFASVPFSILIHAA